MCKANCFRGLYLTVLNIILFISPSIFSYAAEADTVTTTDNQDSLTHIINNQAGTHDDHNDYYQGNTHDEHHGFDLNMKKAERIFYGLYQQEGNTQSCASCHNTFAIDTFNWNPSALDIAKLYVNKTEDDLAGTLLNPTGKVTSKAHANYNFSEEQIQLLKGFLDKYSAEHESLPSKPNITQTLIFIGITLLFLLALVDLLFTKKVRLRALHLIIILFCLVYNTRVVVEEAIALGRQENYQPEQPIKFSHEIHVQQNNIDCRYCHSTVDFSKSASIPPANTCLNCHTLIREGSHSGAFEINKIHEAVESGQPIEWVKVHNLPDHVYFNHAQHVGAGNLDCADCHGVVEEMHEVRQVSDLSMGWCLDCHRTNEIQFTSNKYYAEFEKLHEDLKAGKIDKVTPEMVGATDCMKCHY
ncbi:MAG: hypothetical protein GVY19_07950 [Bacteroidetes bacterium]|jgi:hypothetical protein|nr:hypothetical protein [Bacteroidota bacterium]